MSRDLHSGKQAAVRDAVAMPPGQQLDPGVAAQLRTVGPIAFDTGTFHRIDATHANVTGHFAHPGAGQRATWTFTLVWTHRTWKILDTKPTR